MAGKISDLAALTAPAVGDLLEIVDISDTSLAATGTNKQITYANLLGVFPKFQAHKNGTNQTGIAAATFTKLTWSTETQDTNSNFASDTFTVTEPGSYLFGIAAFLSALNSVAGLGIIVPYKNGVLAEDYEIRFLVGMDHILRMVFYLPSLIATDVIEAYVYSSFGGTDTVNGDIELTNFWGARIS